MILLQNIGHGESWDSQSRTSESQLKKKKTSPKLKMLVAFMKPNY